MGMTARSRLLKEKSRAMHKVVSWFMDCMDKLPATDNEQTMKTVMDAAVKLAALSDGQVSLKLTEHSTTNPAGVSANPGTAMASGARLVKQSQKQEMQTVDEEIANDLSSAID